MLTQMRKAVSISTSVAGTRSVIISRTGRPVLTENADVPVEQAVVSATEEAGQEVGHALFGRRRLSVSQFQITQSSHRTHG